DGMAEQPVLQASMHTKRRSIAYKVRLDFRNRSENHAEILDAPFSQPQKTFWTGVKQDTEKYMGWFNGMRKHGAIGFITPMQKWAQGQPRSTISPPFASGEVLYYYFSLLGA